MTKKRKRKGRSGIGRGGGVGRGGRTRGRKRRRRRGIIRVKRRRRSDVSERPRVAKVFSTLQILRGPTVAALHGCTSIHFFLTVGPGVARRTLAHVGVPAVHFSALATEKAGCVCARVHPVVTIPPRETFRALTPIAAL